MMVYGYLAGDCTEPAERDDCHFGGTLRLGQERCLGLLLNSIQMRARVPYRWSRAFLFTLM